MKKVTLKTIAFLVSFINPGQLNSTYKNLSRVAIFKKSIYAIVKFVIPEKIRLDEYQLFLNQKDAMVSGSIALNVYENFETEIFLKKLKPDMTVIDIGANIGYYTLLAAGRVKTVLAFEPDRVNHVLLQKNVEANSFQNVSCYLLAVSDNDGSVTLYENPENFGDRRIYSFEASGDRVEVEAVSLDTHLNKMNIGQVDFIKMDIQGAEGLALKGMWKLLDQPKLQLLMEFFPTGIRDSGFDPVEVLQTLSDKGFQIYHMNGNKKTLEIVTDFPTFAQKFKNTDYTNLYCAK